MNLQGSILGLNGLPMMGSVNGYEPDTTRRLKTGIVVPYADNYWGGGELVYAKATTTVNIFETCVLIPVLNTSIALPDGSTIATAWELSATPVPNTAGLAQPVGVAIAGMTVGEYGWFAVSASAMPVASTLVGVIGPMYISGTAGRIVTTAANGKQIVSLRSLTAGVTSSVAAVGGVSGGSKVILNSLLGVHVGGTFTAGTGAGTNTLVTSIEPDGRTVNLSVVNTAVPSGTWTFSGNTATAAPFFPVCTFQRPFAQGQVV